jgi:tRNA(Ser,Leu) C12 N-acetylase TAN1
MLLTCAADRGRRAVDEARVLFEESFERMGKSHVLSAGAGGAAGGNGGASNPAGGDAAAAGAAATATAAAAPKSVEAMLAAEVAELRDAGKKAAFRWHDTGVNNTIFVIFPRGGAAPRPSEVAADVVAHVKATKALPARFLLKVLPVEASSFVGVDEISKLAQSYLPERFAALAAANGTESVTFAVEVERRACAGADARAVIDAVAKAVPAPHKVNLGKPDVTVIAQLVRNVCALSVAPRYKALCKYNVRVASEPEDAAEAGGGQGGGGGGGNAAAAAAAEAKDDGGGGAAAGGDGGKEEADAAEAPAADAAAS